MARIQIAKATSGAMFVKQKKATEARLQAVNSGEEVEDITEDIFELQHHHLLQCLEKTTDREFVEIDVPYNGQANRPASTPPLSPMPSVLSHENSLRSCCGRRCRKKKYQEHTGGTCEQDEELNDIQVRIMPNRTPSGDLHRPSLSLSRSSLNSPMPVVTSVKTLAERGIGTRTIVTMSQPSHNSETEAILSTETPSTVRQSPGNNSVVRISVL
ncbi:potassium voltage-gated channel protein Shal-like [Limulus polyphemus]|uniref:Potassium voltage-gated channel protein Shal-like n=1 Tax=Limulus polyphemus TaxID=6850 RepID=A0ABM1RWI3_LIMPO|nr:potassium voltage-gated channel protein Shal-like [Limulus polyphemus]